MHIVKTGPYFTHTPTITKETIVLISLADCTWQRYTIVNIIFIGTILKRVVSSWAHYTEIYRANDTVNKLEAANSSKLYIDNGYIQTMCFLTVSENQYPLVSQQNFTSFYCTIPILCVQKWWKSKSNPVHTSQK